MTVVWFYRKLFSVISAPGDLRVTSKNLIPQFHFNISGCEQTKQKLQHVAVWQLSDHSVSCNYAK